MDYAFLWGSWAEPQEVCEFIKTESKNERKPQIFENLKEIVLFFPMDFQNSLKFFAKFLQKFRNMPFMGFGLGAPEASEFSKILMEISMETLKFLSILL